MQNTISRFPRQLWFLIAEVFLWRWMEEVILPFPRHINKRTESVEVDTDHLTIILKLFRSEHLRWNEVNKQDWGSRELKPCYKGFFQKDESNKNAMNHYLFRFVSVRNKWLAVFCGWVGHWTQMPHDSFDIVSGQLFMNCYWNIIPREEKKLGEFDPLL